MEANKFDHGKPRFDLIPGEALFAVADVFARGAKKYGDRNWENGMDWGRVFAAMQRHAWRWWSGEMLDRDDGQHHLASVIWCGMVLLAYELRGKGKDDRSITEINDMVDKIIQEVIHD